VLSEYSIYSEVDDVDDESLYSYDFESSFEYSSSKKEEDSVYFCS